MKRLFVGFLGMVLGAAVWADSTYHEVLIVVDDVRVSTAPLAGVQAFADSFVRPETPHGIAGCFADLRVDNDEHALLGLLTLRQGDKTPVSVIVEDTLPDVRQWCYVRAAVARVD